MKRQLAINCTLILICSLSSEAQTILNKLNISTNGSVYALAVDEAQNILYLGGSFTEVGGLSRNNVAAIDINTHTVTPWNPDVNNTVHALHIFEGKLYVGGEFTSVGGQTRNRIAAIDMASGAPTPWGPGVDNGAVHAIVGYDNIIYIGGTFTSANTLVRNRLAAINTTSGALTSWDPNVDGSVWCLTRLSAEDFTDVVMVGGDFENIGQSDNNLASFKPDVTWVDAGFEIRFSESLNGQAYAINSTGNYIIAGGVLSLGTKNNLMILKVPENQLWNPTAPGAVRAVAINENEVYGGGGNSSGSVAYLQAWNLSDGSETAWAPSTNGTVRAIAISHGTVYVGGSFTSLNGADQMGIAGLSFLLNPQTITFQALESKTYGDTPFDLTATSTSGLPVPYTSSDPSIASIDGSTVTIHKTGTVTITASQPGDHHHLPAEDVEQILTVSKAPLIAVADNKIKSYGEENPKLTISYNGFVNGEDADAITSPTISTAATTLSDAGQYAITLSGGSADNYDLKSENGTLTITKADQTITFPAIPSKAVGDPDFELMAASTSGLTINYSSKDTTVATVRNNIVTIVGAGITDIMASQPGNTNFNAAQSVLQTLTVTPAPVKVAQTITFLAIPNKTLGGPAFDLVATASSGLPVAFTSSSSKVTINEATVTMTAAGSVSIVARQPGNDQFEPAPEVSRSFCINPAQPAITLSGDNTELPELTSSSASGNRWYRNGTLITGAVNTTYQATEPGVYTVDVVIDNCSSDVSNGYSLVVTTVQEQENDLILYPNPASQSIHLLIPGSTLEETVIVVYDLRGHVIERISTSLNELDISVSAYPSGPYLLSIQQSDAIRHLKFIKK